MNKLLIELKRRNVFRIAMVYAIAGWILMQVGIALETSLNLPGWFDTVITVFILIGFPIALIFAWAFEMTADGVKPTTKIAPSKSIRSITGKKLNVALFGALAVALGVLGWQNLSPSKGASQSAQTQAGGFKTSNQTPNAESEKQSIAVLPFEDFSEDKTQDYFARGISEELLNVLARIDGLRVASRTSAFTFKDQGKSVSEIAEALNVAHILEGSIRKSGDTLRITAQLIDTSNDEHLWSETYDRPLTAKNLFQIQDEISEAIVIALKGKLTVKPPEASGRTLSLEAYETYLKAREDHNKRLPEPLAAAEAGFKRVIELDPNFAPAYSGLADTYMLMRLYAGLDIKEAQSLAALNVKRALELAPNSAEVLTSAAMLENIKNDLDKALDYAARAIKANPNYSVAYHRQALAYSRKGQFALGLKAYQKALSLDPASITLQLNAVASQKSLGDYEGARASADAIIRSHPNAPQGYDMLARLLNETGDYENMHRLLKDSQALNPAGIASQEVLSNLYVNIGLYEQARSVATSSIISSDIETFIPLFEGDKALARRNAKSLTRPNLVVLANYFLGDQAEAYANARKLTEIIGGITPEVVLARPLAVSYIADIYAREGDPDAADIIKQLDAYFQDKGPADFVRSADLIGGAHWQLAKGNPKDALPWIDRMMTLGFIYSELGFAPFDALRDDPEFTALVSRNNETRTRIRKAIEAQLATPAETWLTSDSP